MSFSATVWRQHLFGADWKFRHSNNCSALFGKPHDAEQLPSWRNFQSALTIIKDSNNRQVLNQLPRKPPFWNNIHIGNFKTHFFSLKKMTLLDYFYHNIYFSFVIGLYKMGRYHAKFWWSAKMLPLIQRISMKKKKKKCFSTYLFWLLRLDTELAAVNLVCTTWRGLLLPANTIFEPEHEIMVLFVLRKLILQMRMRSHLVGLDVWFLVRTFVYFHTSCVRTSKALARLRGCTDSPEPSLVP